MPTSSGPMKLETRNCTTPKEAPAPSAAGQTSEVACAGHRPNEPEGHQHRKEGQLAADHRTQGVDWQPGHPGQGQDGAADGPGRALHEGSCSGWPVCED